MLKKNKSYTRQLTPKNIIALKKKKCDSLNSIKKMLSILK